MRFRPNFSDFIKIWDNFWYCVDFRKFRKFKKYSRPDLNFLENLIYSYFIMSNCLKSAQIFAKRKESSEPTQSILDTEDNQSLRPFSFSKTPKRTILSSNQSSLTFQIPQFLKFHEYNDEFLKTITINPHTPLTNIQRNRQVDPQHLSTRLREYSMKWTRLKSQG